ncbi:MAG: hypothetical protein FJ006_11115 [Chloroflexi bacterium]|nr:hypothetical protein [Chloroflexota bacterium]MBM3148986.1 hypothetical protein [Chloroflexota bacterium]MBM3173956.1 hypothetical protein [Chloroflexota bacterium]
MGIFKSLINPIHGLIEANLQAYFSSRVAGDNHRDALYVMVETRYLVTRNISPRDNDIRALVLKELSSISELPSVHDLKRIISLMYVFETGRHQQPVMQRLKFYDDLDKTIEKYRQRYPSVALN